MLEVNELTPVSGSKNLLIVKFNFMFDNSSHLPTITYMMGNKIYLIADESTATNITNNTNYVYVNDKWRQVSNINTQDETIIDSNGNHFIPNNVVQGFRDINVDVCGVLVEKTITANGVYEASDDNADGYSSVDVQFNIKDNFNFISITGLKNTFNSESNLTVRNNNSSDVSILLSDEFVAFNNPITRCNVSGFSDKISIIFIVADAENFDGFYNDSTKITISPTGSVPIRNGACYQVDITKSTATGKYTYLRNTNKIVYSAQ
jgi:hypothetical protein